MPQGMGTYGSKRGRPPKKKGGGGKILGSLSPLYGMITGEGAFGKLRKAGLSPAGALAKKMKKNKQTPVAATAMAKTGGKVKKMKHGGGGLKAVPAGNKGLSKLPTEVRNNMGYMAYGGKVKKMKHGGGTCRGLGKAKRGGKYSRSG